MTETLNETEQPPADVPEETPDEPGVSDDEATEDEEAAEEETQPEPPETPEVADDTVMEAVFEKAAKRAKTYMTAVPDILGEASADLSLCPRCTDLLPGWILPLRIKPVTDEQKIAVKQSIGELIEADYVQDKHSSTCPDCNGLGKVSTGSLVQSQRIASCESCGGRGWIGPRAAKLGSAPAPMPGLNGGDTSQTHEEKPLQDPWGRLIDDPLYGVMPGFERD